VTLADNSTFDVEIGGTSPGNTSSNHDQLNVTGTVTIGNNVSLNLSALGGFVPIAGNTFVILNNDGADLITGTFSGLAEGATIANFLGSGLSATITYIGGVNNNDVVLTAITTTTTTVSLDGSGNLVIDDTDGADTNDSLTIQSDTTNNRFVISDPNNKIATMIAGATGSGTNTVQVPFASVSGSRITVTTRAGDDSLAVDFAQGNFAKTISYDGGAQTTGDSLTLTGGPLGGGSFASVTHTFTSDSAGVVDITGNSQISYTSLESVTDNLSATVRTFTFDGGSEVITLADAAGAAMTIDSTLGASVTFANPASSLTINAGTGDDAVTVSSIDATGPFSANLTIAGDSGTDSVTFQTNAIDVGVGAISVTAEAISVNSALSAGGAINLTSNGDDATLSIAAALTAGVSSAFVSDRMIINAPVSVGGNDLTLHPETNADSGDAIDLGSTTDTAADTLELSDAELDQITAGRLIIGAATAGSVVFSAAIAMAGTDTVDVTTGGTINDMGNSTVFTDTNLALSAAAGIGTTSTLNVSVANLAATAPAGGVNVTNAGGVNLTTVGSVVGIAAAAGGDVSITAGSITVSQPVSATGVGTVTLTAQDDAAGDITVNNTITTASGSITISADDDIHSGAAGTLTTTAGSVGLTAGIFAGGMGSPNVGTIAYTADVNHGSAGSTWSLTDATPGAGFMSGVISGTGPLTKQGAGQLNLTGTSANTFTGTTTVNAGVLGLGKTAQLNALGGPVAITGGTLRLLQSDQIPNTTDVSATNLGVFDIAALSETIDALTGDGAVTGVAGGALSIGANHEPTPQFSGTISGSVALTKTGAGAQTLSGANTYTGATTVSAGRLNVNGSTASGSAVTVQSAATLGGTGMVAGAVSVQNGGTAAPGTSPGIFSTGSIAFASNATFEVEIGGTSPGNLATNHDQLNVAGTISLAGATLSLAAVGGFTPAGGEQFVIISNDGSAAVTGTFNGLAEGATITNFLGSGLDASITYTGGTDANDVVLAAQLPPTTTVSLDASGNLVIDDTQGGDTDDTLTIKSDTANNKFIIIDPNHTIATSIAGATGNGLNVVEVPFASVSGTQILISTQAGADNLTVDFALGNFSKSISYTGGDPTSSPGDALTLTGGGPFSSVAHTFAGSADGTVAISGNATISYAGLEPVADNLSAIDRLFTFTGGDETITVSDDAASGNGKSKIESTLGESVTFANPVASLTVNAGSGTDAIDVEGLDSNFSASLVIDGNDGNDAATFKNNATSTGAGSVNVVAEATTISAAVAGASVSITAHSIAVDATITANGGITLQPDDDADTIGLESASGSFNLSEAELKNLSSTGTVTIGRATGAGAVTIADTGNVINLASEQFDVVIHGGSTTISNILTISTNKTVTFNTGAISDGNGAGINVNGSAAATLIINSTGSVTLDTSIGRYGSIATNGPLTLANTSSMVVPTLFLTAPISSANHPITLSENATFTMSQNVGATIDAGSSTVSVTADTIELNAMITGNTSVTLRPTTGSRAIRLNDPTETNSFNLSAAEIGQISSTGAVTIGAVGGSGAVAIGASAPIDLSGESFDLTLHGGEVTFSNGMTLADNKTLSFVTGSITSGVGVDATIGGSGTVRIATSGAVGGSGSPFSAAVGNITASTTGNNDMFLSEADVATIAAGGLDAGTGVVHFVGGTFALGGPDRINDSSSVHVDGGTFDIATHDETAALVTLASGTITGTTGALASAATFDIRSGTASAMLAGTSGLAKSTGGTATLTSANTYTGATTIAAGTLLVNGSITASSPVTVKNTGTLGGDGTIAGTLSVESGGKVAPGASTAIINTGSVSFAAGSTLAIELNGTTVGTLYDQLNVSGSVNLGGATLDISLGFAPSNGDLFTIVNNDGVDAIGGTFAGLVEGATIVVGGTTLVISYVGGTGNDVVLTIVPAPTFDFGDAPDPLAGTAGQYATLLANNGPRHIVGALFLGTGVDDEADGQPNATATGDDGNGADDEDGVAFPTTLVARLGASATVTASGPGRLDAWIDFDQSGTFDADEQIATSLALAGGANTISFAVSADAVAGETFARFRFSTAGGLGPTGPATDGEVEDHAVQIIAPADGTATVLSDPMSPGKDMLLVIGTAAADSFLIQKLCKPGTPRLRVRIGSVYTAPFATTALSRVVVFGLGGNDRIIMTATLPTNAMFDGGPGNDILLSGAGSDILIGGPGNDQLDGRTGRDIVIGGAGSDRLVGDRGAAAGGDDMLIAGSTLYDANDVALSAILAEWTSNLSFTQRVNRLVAGVGSPPLNLATVLDDMVLDQLRDDSALNWFIVGVVDQLIPPTPAGRVDVHP
jgi:autotransporter-associated beta strand protein